MELIYTTVIAFLAGIIVGNNKSRIWLVNQVKTINSNYKKNQQKKQSPPNPPGSV